MNFVSKLTNKLVGTTLSISAIFLMTSTANANIYEAHDNQVEVTDTATEAHAPHHKDESVFHGYGIEKGNIDQLLDVGVRENSPTPPLETKYEKIFGLMDEDKDGYVSKEEFISFSEKMAERKIEKNRKKMENFNSETYENYNDSNNDEALEVEDKKIEPAHNGY